MRRGGIPVVNKTNQNAVSLGDPNSTGQSGFQNQAGATGQSQARGGMGTPAQNNFFGGTAADGYTQMINTGATHNDLLDPRKTQGSQKDKRQGSAAAGQGQKTGDGGDTSLRRGTVKSGAGDKGDGQNALNGRRPSVEAVLNQFRQGNRDVKQAYDTIKNIEGASIPDILAALEQLSDILCQVTYFSKAYEILSTAAKDINGSPVLHELIARVAFVMEDFKKCIYHNTKAAKLQPEECSHNKSDIGLAYYRMGLQTADTKHFESGFKFCREALELNSMNSNAMVNMGLIYKHQNGIEDALKMFKAARQHDPTNVAAIVNIGCIEYEEYQHFDQAAIYFLDALEIKPDDEEALCNLALALKRTSYIDYAKMAFEEAVNVSPGNTFILTNYMMFLLEQQNFDQFNKVMPHARRVMDRLELETIQKLHDEFREAIDGTQGKSIPEDERAGSRSSSAGGLKSFQSALRANLLKKLGGVGSSKPNAATEMQPVAEGEGEEDDAY